MSEFLWIWGPPGTSDFSIITLNGITFTQTELLIIQESLWICGVGSNCGQERYHMNTFNVTMIPLPGSGKHCSWLLMITHLPIGLLQWILYGASLKSIGKLHLVQDAVVHVALVAPWFAQVAQQLYEIIYCFRVGFQCKSTCYAPPFKALHEMGLVYS